MLTREQLADILRNYIHSLFQPKRYCWAAHWPSIALQDLSRLPTEIVEAALPNLHTEVQSRDTGFQTFLTYDKKSLIPNKMKKPKTHRRYLEQHYQMARLRLLIEDFILNAITVDGDPLSRLSQETQLRGIIADIQPRETSGLIFIDAQVISDCFKESHPLEIKELLNRLFDRLNQEGNTVIVFRDTAWLKKFSPCFRQHQAVINEVLQNVFVIESNGMVNHADMIIHICKMTKTHTAVAYIDQANTADSLWAENLGIPKMTMPTSMLAEDFLRGLKGLDEASVFLPSEPEPELRELVTNLAGTVQYLKIIALSAVTIAFQDPRDAPLWHNEVLRTRLSPIGLTYNATHRELRERLHTNYLRRVCVNHPLLSAAAAFENLEQYSVVSQATEAAKKLARLMTSEAKNIFVFDIDFTLVNPLTNQVNGGNFDLLARLFQTLANNGTLIVIMTSRPPLGGQLDILHRILTELAQYISAVVFTSGVIFKGDAMKLIENQLAELNMPLASHQFTLFDDNPNEIDSANAHKFQIFRMPGEPYPHTDDWETFITHDYVQQALVISASPGHTVSDEAADTVSANSPR